MINKVKDYLNNHPQDFAQYILPSINGIPTIDDVKYDSSYADFEGICDKLMDLDVLDFHEDWGPIAEKAIDEFYNNFKFVDVKVLDLQKHIYKIIYSFAGTEYYIIGDLDEEGNIIPLKEDEL